MILDKSLDMDKIKLCKRFNPELADHLSNMAIEKLQHLVFPDFNLKYFRVISQMPFYIYNDQDWVEIDDLRMVDKKFYTKWGPEFESFARNELICELSEPEQLLYSIEFGSVKYQVLESPTSTDNFRMYNLIYRLRPRETEAFSSFLREVALGKRK